MEQAVRQRPGRAQVVGASVGALHLPENLRLADDERVEARGDAEQVTGGVGPLVDVEMPGHLVVVDAVILAEETANRVGGRVAIGGGIDLGAIAGREDDRLLSDAPGAQRRERRVRARAARSPRSRATRRAPCGDSGRPRIGALLEVVALRQEEADGHEVQQHDDERDRRQPRGTPSAPSDCAARQKGERVDGPADERHQDLGVRHATCSARADPASSGPASPRFRRRRCRSSERSSRSSPPARSSCRATAATAAARRRIPGVSP